LLLPAPAWAYSSPIYIADMHFHLFFLGKRPAKLQPLGINMAAGGATLVAWSVVGDQPWLAPAAGTFRQSGKPGRGDAGAWLREELGRVKAHLAEQKLPIAETAEHIAAAQAGKPHVVLSVEGATFADDGVAEVQRAYDQGVRHIQIVHFIANRLGDMQTELAVFSGLSALGRDVVDTCNRLGILIDLAHCTEPTVDQVLERSKAPVVWSHSSVATASRWFGYGGATWTRRQLSLGAAKRIAAKGGVVGLWALGADVGTTPESYADRILALADTLGDDHVAFGTDMNALGQPALANFADLRRVVVALEKKGVAEARVRKIAMANYARVLTAAMRARAA
jgi:membrane dipeptidase